MIDRKLLGKFSVVLLLLVVSKLTGFGKDVVLSYYHGSAALTDSYFIANSLASLIYSAVYLSVPAIVIPIYTRMLRDTSVDGVYEELSSIFQSFVFISLAITIVIYYYSNQLVYLLLYDSSVVVLERTAYFLRVVALTFVFSTIVAFFNALQVAKGLKVPSFIVPIVNNFTFIIALSVFSSEFDFKYVLWSGLIAWGGVALANYFMTRKNFSYKGSVSLPLFYRKYLIALFFPLLLAFYIEQVNSYISVYFSSGLGEGAVSTISYANKLNFVVISVFTVFLTTHIFPLLSKSRSDGAIDKLEDMSGMIFRWITLLSLPLLLVLFQYSNQIVALLFERGNFHSENVSAVSNVLEILSFTLPLILIRDFLNRVFFAQENTLLPMLAILTSIVLHAIFSFFLSIQYGVLGVAIAMVIGLSINVLIQLLFLNRILNANLLVGGGRSIWSGISATLLCYLLIKSELLGNYVSWILEALLMFFMYFWMLLCLRVKEAVSVYRAAKKMLF